MKRPNTSCTHRVRSRVHRPALTVVELLTSLALLSALAGACAGVVRAACWSSADATRDAAWSRGAAALLESIGADLASADLDPVGDWARGDPRVRVLAEGPSVCLSIRTRDPVLGPCVRRYSTTGSQVLVSCAALPSAGSFAPPPPLDRGTTALPARLIATFDGQAGVLHVAVVRGENSRAARIFVLDRERNP